MSNPNGLGGFQPGHPPLSLNGGRPKSVSAIQLYALAKCREAIDVAARVMKEPKEGDSVRLRACEMILDRGVGRPGQQVALDIGLTQSLETMNVEQLAEFRRKYAAVVTASPRLIEEVIADQERAEPELPLGDVNGGTNDGAADNRGNAGGSTVGAGDGGDEGDDETLHVHF
jgi:hypothetical protein